MILLPVNLSFPFFLSILKTTIELSSWFATSKYFPDGSMVKFLGVFIFEFSHSTNSGLRDSVLKIAILSGHLFEA